MMIGFGPRPSNPLFHRHAWCSSGTLSRGRWLKPPRHRLAQMSRCFGSSDGAVDLSCGAVIRLEHQGDGQTMSRHCSPHSELAPAPSNYLYDKPLTASADRAARARVPSPLPPLRLPRRQHCRFSTLATVLATRGAVRMQVSTPAERSRFTRRTGGTGCHPRPDTTNRIRLTGARQPTPLASSHRAGSNANVPPSLSVTCDLQECLETRRGVGTELRALEEQETHSCATQRSRSTWRY